jgi:hypothetical protein
MKKSEEYRQQAQEAEHVLASLGLHTKAIREERKERFEEEILPQLRKLFVVEENTGYVKIDTMKYGPITIYPKANKLCIHHGQKWRKPAVRWIIKNLLKN